MRRCRSSGRAAGSRGCRTSISSADAEAVREVTSLGLTYSLLTRYTSFIAVLEEVRNTTGQAADVDQPLPLPDGVSDLAVGYWLGRGAGILVPACSVPRDLIIGCVLHQRPSADGDHADPPERGFRARLAILPCRRRVRRSAWLSA